MSSFPVKAVRRIRRRTMLMRYALQADSFLTSYPKSGRTWFRYLLSHYFADVAGIGQAIDLHNMFSVVPNFDLDTERGIPGFNKNGIEYTIPKIWVSHLHYRRTLFFNRPVILMVRDPRDVVVSAYFHATRHKHRFAGGLTEFVSDGEQGLPAMCRYLNGWAKGLSHRRHHIVSYEALSRQTEVETTAALAFLGCAVEPEALRRAVDAGRFEAMQEQEIAQGIPAHDYDRSDKESLRMRRGRVGAFSEYMDPGLVGLVDDICRRQLSSSAKRLLAPTGFVRPIV
ncbi:sulfotransferase domain-containing protein [Rhizobium sullae]|uniref:Sulfotransferase n=2 Tax=Rhizobium sullae TaxID=50338 RepID=A0A2N0D7Q5_RHISU|nr:sulfotransferase domain-containing protein [Rhizobium sullae]PKA42106.1 sulfotransferase [Rhizobium sullae]